MRKLTFALLVTVFFSTGFTLAGFQSAHVHAAEEKPACKHPSKTYTGTTYEHYPGCTITNKWYNCDSCHTTLITTTSRGDRCSEYDC